MWEDKVQRQQNPHHKTFISIQLGEIFKNSNYDDSFLLENEKGIVYSVVDVIWHVVKRRQCPQVLTSADHLFSLNTFIQFTQLDYDNLFR